MGFLDFFRTLPQWARQMPPHLRPSTRQIRELEGIRTECGVDHMEFLLHIAGHPVTSRRVQTMCYQQIRAQMPSAPEREVLEQLVVSRYVSSAQSEADLFGLRDVGDDEDRFQTRIEEIVSQYPELNSLIEAMVEEEARTYVSHVPAFDGAVRRISNILSRE